MPLRAGDIRLRVEADWEAFRALIAERGNALGEPTASGWTAKEMLAHVAFWDEAVVPVVVTILRGADLPPGWTFGSGDLGLPEGEWPPAEVHNAREAAWARSRSSAEVIERCDRAHSQLLALLDTVTDEEVADNLDYFLGLGGHYREHAAELDRVGR